MKKCPFPNCSAVFDAKTSRQTYCQNPHPLLCTSCGELHLQLVKNVNKTKGECSDCRKVHQGKKRKDALKRKIYTCKFINCKETFSSEASRVLYCSKQHKLPCTICGEKFSVKASKNPATTCSSCSEKARLEKIKATNLERYGVKNVFEAPEVKEKALKTIQDRFGADHIMRSSEGVRLHKEAMLEKYGVESPLQVPEILEKVRKTCEEKYGVEWAAKAEEVKEKIKATNKEKYNVEWYVENEEFAAKAQATSLEKYGVLHPSQAIEVKEKIAKTNLERYGSKSSLANAEVREKARLTRRSTRGVDHPTQDPEVRAKVVATCLEKYGCENVFQNDGVKAKALKTFETRLNKGAYKGSKKASKHNFAKASLIREAFDLDEDAITFEAPLGAMQFDLQIGKLLVDFNPTISHNQERAFACVVKGCPSSCSDHSPIPANYHYQRAKLAKKADLSLVQIYDWVSDEAMVRLLAGKLETNWEKHSARRLLLKSITQNTANKFLAQEHVQGGVRGQKFCYGLFQGEECLAVATFGSSRFKNQAEYEFLRFAVRRGHIIHGGAQKLWQAFLQEASPESVVSYIDFDHTTAAITFLSGLGFQETAPTGPAKVWSKREMKIPQNTLLRQGADRLLGTSYGTRNLCGLDNEAIMLLEGWLPVSTAGNRVFMWGKESDSCL